MLILSGQSGIEWRAESGKCLIGRGTHCDFIIDDETVSRTHAELEILDDGSLMLSDRESRNGTYINGVVVSAPVKLRDGDLVRFGGVEFEAKDSAASRDEFPRSTETDDENTSLTRFSMEKVVRRIDGGSAVSPKAILAISDLGRMLVIPGSEKEIFDKALALLGELIPSNRMALFLTDEGESDLRLTSIFGEGAGDDGVNFRMSRTIMGEVMDRKNAVMIQDTGADSKFAGQGSVIMSKIRSAIAVPLQHADSVMGILYIDSSDHKIDYSEDHLRIVAIFANILASKVTNLRFLSQIKAKEALESEISIASQIQKSFLPRQLPSIEGYGIGAFQNQCQLVGGDLYDISTLADGRILFLLGDVSGKGAGAAMLASNILASFRVLYDAKGLLLNQTVSRVSEQLLNYSRPGDFATLFMGILDPKSHIISYINAGHNPPMVVREGGIIESLEPTGIPIGVFDQPVWKEEVIDLKTGDFLFAFTDGIPDATNRHNEQFGEDRLKTILREFRDRPLSDYFEHINSEIRKFEGGAPKICDDITIVLIKREI